MYNKVLRLILSTAFAPADSRTSEEIQEDVLHVLGTLTRFRTQPWQDGIVEPAARFVQSSAWSLILAKSRHERGQCVLPAEKLAELDQALRNHFQPIEEENHGHQAVTG